MLVAGLDRVLNLLAPEDRALVGKAFARLEAVLPEKYGDSVRR